MRRARGAPLGYRVVAALVIACHHLLRWRLDARGYDNIPAGGAVVTWNHTSHLDVVATAIPLHQRTSRWLRFLALRDLWGRPLLGGLLRLVGCIPVERRTDAGRAAAFADAVAALRAGDLVLVAPEAQISPSLELLPFRTGAARMAQAAGVPVVPTASWGTHRVSTLGRAPSLRRGWRLSVTIRVGEPLHVGPDDDPVAATEALRSRTQELLDDARAAHPGTSPVQQERRQRSDA